METINAKIESTMLGFEDRGIMTWFLTLDFGGTGQGFGGYALGGATTDFAIKRILKVVGVEKWEDLKGKYIRVKREPRGLIKSIGNLLEDKWFDPGVEFKNLAQEKDE